MVLVDGVPLLDAQLLWSCACLRRQQLLEVTNGVVWVALDAYLFAEAIVADAACVGKSERASSHERAKYLVWPHLHFYHRRIVVMLTAFACSCGFSRGSGSCVRSDEKVTCGFLDIRYGLQGPCRLHTHVTRRSHTSSCHRSLAY